MSAILSVSNLKKSYGNYLAVNDLTFELKKGEVLGLLGPNGAGKTTTTQILLGLTEPDSGTISYFGKNFFTNKEEILSRINFASAYSELQGKLSVRQNLKIFAGLYGVNNADKKIAELLKLLEIEQVADTLFWHLSSGQQTRAILAKGLINDPEIILMDEPTASLDPDIVNKIIDLIRDLQKQKQVSILFTSHNMEEVSRLCDKVMIMHKGRIAMTDTPLNLAKQIKKTELIITFDSSKEKVSQFLIKEKLDFSFIRNEIVTISLTEEQIPGLLFDFKDQNIWVQQIDIKKPTMEDVFLSFSKTKDLTTDLNMEPNNDK